MDKFEKRTRYVDDLDDVDVSSWDREKLIRVLEKEWQLLRVYERKLEEVKIIRMFDRRFDFMAYSFVFFLGLVYVLSLSFFSYNSEYTRFLGFSLSSITTAYCCYKAKTLFSRFFLNEETITDEQLKNDVDLLRDFSTSNLKYKMAEYVEASEFELAAFCRDELSKRI